MSIATAAAPARNNAKVLTLSALGGALEFYDFVVFVFFAKTLGGCSSRPTFRRGWRTCRCSGSSRPATWCGRSAGW